MIELLKDQPPEAHARILEILNLEAFPMAVMVEFDFKDGSVRLCSRNIPFEDLRWGHTWQAGAGLLVGLPDVNGSDGDLAPYREYQLGIPNKVLEADSWQASLTKMVRDERNYKRRKARIYQQLFDPDTNKPVGYPMALEVGVMDYMGQSQVDDVVQIKLTTESFMARKGTAVHGRLTYHDQIRRHPTDEGCGFTAEANKSITWPNWG